MEDAARYALVSRLLTSTFTKLHRRTALDTKYSSWKYSGVQTGNPQQVDEIVFSQSKQEEVVLEEACMFDLSSYKGWCILWTRKGRKEE